jgi:hypothetical protein
LRMRLQAARHCHVACLRLLDRSVVVAVVAVRVVQVAIHQVIGVIAMGHGVVTAFRAVLVSLFVAATIVFGRAIGRVAAIDSQAVFFDFGTLDVVQMAIVQVINVAVVDDTRVAASRTMLMGMAFVVRCHLQLSFLVVERWSSFQFQSMRQCVLNQVGDVPI